MILTCPSCGTQYVVKDGAIPPGGRQVRCAACKHSWHQDPEDEAAPAEEPEIVEQAPAEQPIAEDAQLVPSAEEEPTPAADEESDDDESLAEATLIEPRSGPEVEERAHEEAAADEQAEAPARPAAAAASRTPATCCSATPSRPRSKTSASWTGLSARS